MLSAFHTVAKLPLAITLWCRCCDQLHLTSGEIKDQNDQVAYPSVGRKISIHIVLQIRRVKLDVKRESYKNKRAVEDGSVHAGVDFKCNTIFENRLTR